MVEPLHSHYRCGGGKRDQFWRLARQRVIPTAMCHNCAADEVYSMRSRAISIEAIPMTRVLSDTDTSDAMTAVPSRQVQRSVRGITAGCAASKLSTQRSGSGLLVMSR